MPFKSKAQMRWMFAAERRGEVPKGTAKRWAHETSSIKSLPEKKSKKKASLLDTLTDKVDTTVALAMKELENEEVRKDVIEKAIKGGILGSGINLIQGQSIPKGLLIGALLGASWGLASNMMQ